MHGTLVCMYGTFRARVTCFIQTQLAIDHPKELHSTSWYIPQEKMLCDPTKCYCNSPPQKEAMRCILYTRTNPYTVTHFSKTSLYYVSCVMGQSFLLEEYSRKSCIVSLVLWERSYYSTVPQEML